jgi:hypothetical protein
MTPADDARALAGRFVAFLETGTPDDGLFTADVFCDFTMPHWRLQRRTPQARLDDSYRNWQRSEPHDGSDAHLELLRQA